MRQDSTNKKARRRSRAGFREHAGAKPPSSAVQAEASEHPTRREPRRSSSSAQLFLDASGTALQVAQVVQLGADDVAAALDDDFGDLRAVGLEHALHTFAVADLANRKRGVQAARALGDDHTF